METCRQSETPKVGRSQWDTRRKKLICFLFSFFFLCRKPDLLLLGDYPFYSILFFPPLQWGERERRAWEGPKRKKGTWRKKEMRFKSGEEITDGAERWRQRRSRGIMGGKKGRERESSCANCVEQGQLEWTAYRQPDLGYETPTHTQLTRGTRLHTHKYISHILSLPSLAPFLLSSHQSLLPPPLIPLSAPSPSLSSGRLEM